WNDSEIAALLQYLDNQKLQSEEVGNFKDPVWKNAPETIKDHHSRGPVKTAKTCQNKWSTLKATYNSIEGYHNASGFHFDNVNGANIKGETAKGICNDIVAKKPELKPFRNKGWVYYEVMQSIMFSTAAHGIHIY
ncbi:hypothetical protein L208DRAFT_1245794, partial [Tricholoma matsutake]